MRNLLFALILAVGLFLPFAQPVQATTQDRAIQGEGALTQGTYVGGAGTYANLNSDDGDTSYIEGAGAAEYRHTYNMVDTAISVASITSVTVTYSTAPGSIYTGFHPICRISGVNYEDVDSSWSGTAGYTTHTKVYTTDPSTGLEWANIAAINAAEFGFFMWGGSSIAVVSYMKITIDYVPVTMSTVTTQATSLITSTTATGNGNITSNGGGAMTEKGICYIQASSGDPTTASSTSHDHINSTGAFTEPITGLTKGLPYRLRAYAINSVGTSYGTTVDMTTIGDPTISTVAASLVTESTARLNSQVTFDGKIGGGELCTVTFAYKIGTLATYDLCAAGTTPIVAGTTYTVNQLSYVDIASLTGSSTYSFAVKISNATGTDIKTAAITFATTSGVYIPTNFTAIPTSTTISYAWAKGAGAQYTLVRYSGSAYPATITDGSLGYLNTANSFQLSGIAPGTPIYASVWGKTGTTYSGTGPGYTDGKIDIMVTTLAYDSTSTTGSLVTPTPSSTWIQTPDSTKVSTIPVFGPAVSAVAVAYNQPVNYLWYFIWILTAVGAAIAVYIRGNFNFVLALSTMIGIIGIGVFWFNLVAGLVVLVLAVIGIGWALVGFRRPGT